MNHEWFIISLNFGKFLLIWIFLALKDNDLGAIYVNLTEPIQQLKDEITKTVDTCREIGSNRYITEYWLQNMEDRIDLAHKAVKNGILDDIPEWPEDQADDLADLARDVKNLEKE